MPHYKCDACRLRLRTSGKLIDDVSALCPECGAPLEPAADLRELVGFRSITQRKAADTLDAATRWLGDDEPQARAIALPRPETYT